MDAAFPLQRLVTRQGREDFTRHMRLPCPELRADACATSTSSLVNIALSKGEYAMRSSRLLIAALAASALLGAAVGSASARNLSVNEQGFRISWAELNWTESVFRVGIHCPMTLEGTFHYRTMVKAIGSLIGYVTRAILDNAACRGGHFTVLTETLPWHVTYEGFTGTLPRITGLILLIAGMAMRMEVPAIGLSCLMRAANLRYTTTGTREAGGAFKAERVVPGRESIPCGSINLTFEGTGTGTRLGSTERTLVTLI